MIIEVAPSATSGTKMSDIAFHAEAHCTSK